MTANHKISEKWVLVVEDMEGMRSQLRMSLTASGFAKLHLVASIKEATERMAANKYDIILCDYTLGEGTDGQQFLEHLRNNDLISRNTIFIMITGEQGYEKVMAASECALDDYLLKPFTAGQFNARLEKLLEKQSYFAVIDKTSDAKNWARVIIECDKKLAAKDRHFIELCKIKGVALLRDNRPQDAANLYSEVLALRPVSWAKLGLAKALAELNQQIEARKLLNEILVESPQFMAAYDFLGKLLVDTGDKEAALAILQKAREVSPGTLSRVRELSTLAVRAGKPELAENLLRQALQKHRYSPVKQPNDYAVLSKALVNQGKATEALAIVAEAKKSFNDERSAVLLAASECVAQHAAGNAPLAEAALAKAMAHGDVSSLSTHTVLSLADACFAMQKEDDAIDLLRHAIQNNHEDDEIKGLVHDVLTAAGKDDEQATELIETSAQEVIQLNNEGVLKAQAGELVEAIEMLCEAADRLPNNQQLLGNAGLVLALDLVRNGHTPDKLERCIHYRNALIKKSRSHPKLAQIDEQLRKLKPA